VTVFGPDLSSYQHGLDLSRLSDATFVIAKTTEGTYYTDADYQGWRRQAAALGRLFGWYHYLSTEPVAGQVAHTKSNVGDVSLFGMLDVESSSGNLAQVLAYVDAAHAAGLNLRLVYLPHWYWQQIGSPDLSPLAARGVHLISSSYPGGAGSPTSLYPGDSASGWGSYGGMTPLLYQYTNQASDGGMALDYNAFRGAEADLAAVLYQQGVPGMSIIPPSIAQKWPELASEFPPNGAYTDEGATIWADAGARAAALFARQGRDAINALAAHIGAPIPQPVDVNALAAALAPQLHPSTDVPALVAALIPHLAAGATADEISAAVTARMAADLQKG
jgi:lysozyme